MITSGLPKIICPGARRESARGSVRSPVRLREGSPRSIVRGRGLTGMRDPLIVMRIRRNERRHTFGMVRQHANGKPKAHQGWDLSAAPGTPIYAIADGSVAFTSHAGAYGLQ